MFASKNTGNFLCELPMWLIFWKQEDNLTEHVQREFYHSSLFLIREIQGVATVPGLPYTVKYNNGNI